MAELCTALLVEVGGKTVIHSAMRHELIFSCS
jgi:hypothetical protein